MREFGYVQQVIEDFFNSEDQMMVVSILPDTYANPNSASCAYRCAIKKLGYNITIRMINGNVYLIKTKTSCWTARNQKGICATCARRYPSKYCAICTNRSCYKEKDHD